VRAQQVAIQQIDDILLGAAAAIAGANAEFFAQRQQEIGRR
jgi:hypothetical protein